MKTSFFSLLLLLLVGACKPQSEEATAAQGQVKDSTITGSDKDENGNAIDGDVMVYNTQNCVIKTPKDRLVVVNGLDNFIVAEFDNVLMICKKEKEQEIKDELQLIRNTKGSQKIANNNLFQLPNRLWQFLLQHAGVKEEWRWADLPSKEQNKLVQLLCNHEFHVKGKTTFKEEFVTAGGVDLKQVDPNTMQSKLQSNLFFAGEILDVDGITGGFNFQHAWTSGFIAAKSIASLVK